MIKTFENYSDIEDLRFKIISALWTMLEGDDVYFDNIDDEDPIYKEIGYNAVEDDPDEWTENLDKEGIERVYKILKDKDFI